MAGYVHRTARQREAQRSAPSLTPSLREQLVALATEDLLAHQQKVKAGVPGCSCGQGFATYPTMPSEHARHAAEEVVDSVLAALGIADARGPKELAAATA